VRSEYRNRWRQRRIFWLTALAALSAASATLGAIRKADEPLQLGIFQRPAIGDLDTINEVAEKGVAQSVKFKAGARISHFIAKKCGLPAATLEMHPVYESILLQRNVKSELAHQDMFRLRKDAAIEMPACVAFSTLIGQAVVPVEGGIAKLAEGLSIPFSSTIFANAIGSSELHSKLSDAVKHAEHGEAFDEFRLLSDQLCKDVSPVPLLGCLNALTIAGANPELADAKSIRGGKIFVPIAGLRAPALAELDRVPLNPAAIAADFERDGFCSYSLTSYICSLGSSIKQLKVASVIKNTLNFNTLTGFNTGFKVDYHVGVGQDSEPQPSPTPSPKPQKPTAQKGREAALKFVTEVDAPETYESCANANELNPGKWPFDVAEFERAAGLSDIQHNHRKGRILVADTGFDFTGDGGDDATLLQQTQNIFLRKYFHVLEKGEDPDPQYDLNLDGVFGNGDWAGVNLAGRAGGDTSSQSVADDPYREHGLSVTTLALGGRQLEALRGSDKLKFEIGEVNLVPKYDPTYLATVFVGYTVKFAKARGNDFDVINLSLSSEVHDPIWDSLAIDAGKQLAFVVAAGNDGKELTSSAGVWPAALGGGVATDDPSTTSFITVGAHNGKGEYVKFSNYGAGVDLFAPGCAVPSYVLKLDADRNLAGIAEKSITGTSAAAPLVSFAAGLLAGSFQFDKQPAAIKTRIQIGTDYDYSLQSLAVSSGIFNIAKAIGFKHDIIELVDKDHPASSGRSAGKLVYGTATLASDDGKFKCDLGPAIPLNAIMKIARAKTAKEPILVLAADDRTKRNKLTPHFCDQAALSKLTIQFTDAETQASTSIDMTEFRDYIAKR
jgi:Subtilase family